MEFYLFCFLISSILLGVRSFTSKYHVYQHPHVVLSNRFRIETHSLLSRSRSKRSERSISSGSYLPAIPSLSMTGYSMNDKLSDLKVGIVGGGPSGLLLAHGLVQAGAQVSVFEKRSRPGELDLEKRAYALGVGLRGRTAIQKVDSSFEAQIKSNHEHRKLWDVIKVRGYGSERFILHLGPLQLRLRDEKDADNGKEGKLEPSLLLFQSDLCRSLADELENRWKNSGRISLKFDSPVLNVDLVSKTVTTKNDYTENFDLIVGSDGVNSIVRRGMSETWPTSFNASQESLQGFFKVARLPFLPPLVDPTAVQLLFPRKGSTTCFIEPTCNGQCCLLFAGRNDPTDILLSFTDGQSNVTSIEKELVTRFPKLLGSDLHKVAQQLLDQEPSQASKVQCNIFHCNDAAVLIGDAAHATGGVSGQGVNSAFIDASVLIDSLIQYFDSSNKEESIRCALLNYSKKAVPEAKALYDLSFGPSTVSPITSAKLKLKNIVDSLFKGRFGIGERPLNTLLTTSLESFAAIRRRRDQYYPASFPNQVEWETVINTIDEAIRSSSPSKTTPSSYLGSTKSNDILI